MGLKPCISSDDFSDFCTLVQDTNHIYRVIANPFNSLSVEEACSENILHKQISLVLPKNKELTAQLCPMYVFPGRLNAPVSRRNTITQDFEK